MHLDSFLESLFGGIFLLLEFLLKGRFLFGLTSSDLIDGQIVDVVDDATDGATSSTVDLG